MKPEALRAVAERYAKLMGTGDWKAIVALFADDATMEDPVGAEVHRGIEAITVLYQTSSKIGVGFEVTGPIRVAGSEVAFPLIATLPSKDGQKSFIDVIDLMAFNESGKISSLRAFWRPQDIRSA